MTDIYVRIEGLEATEVSSSHSWFQGPIARTLAALFVLFVGLALLFLYLFKKRYPRFVNARDLPGAHKYIGVSYHRTPKEYLDLRFKLYYPISKHSAKLINYETPKYYFSNGNKTINGLVSSIIGNPNFYENQSFLYKIYSYILNTLFTLLNEPQRDKKTPLQLFVNAPILMPNAVINNVNNDKTTTVPKYPVIIFSHGWSASWDFYSQICMSLASFGFIVIIFDHKDGSAAYTTNINNEDILFKHSNIRKKDETRKDIINFRKPQLKQRIDEYCAMFNYLKSISNGSNVKINIKEPNKSLSSVSSVSSASSVSTVESCISSVSSISDVRNLGNAQNGIEDVPLAGEPIPITAIPKLTTVDVTHINENESTDNINNINNINNAGNGINTKSMIGNSNNRIINKPYVREPTQVNAIQMIDGNNIFACGHSYGGITAALSCKELMLKSKNDGHESDIDVSKRYDYNGLKGLIMYDPWCECADNELLLSQFKIPSLALMSEEWVADEKKFNKKKHVSNTKLLVNSNIIEDELNIFYQMKGFNHGDFCDAPDWGPNWLLSYMGQTQNTFKRKQALELMTAPVFEFAGRVCPKLLKTGVLSNVDKTSDSSVFESELYRNKHLQK